jgi:Kef-type K+ transport system membrane component KefB/mannitol/fructose-specific phosphotransferase system IIA component (Ntr-type)
MLPVTDPVLVFTILALGMLVAPVFSEKLRIPDLVLLLGFGALLGPNGLHVLERSSAVTMLGAIGLLYIMFLAGLEIDLYRFSRSYKRSIVFGLLTFIIPQTLGTLAGRYVLGMSWSASLLLASMFASHTLLAYPAASRLGISRSEPVAITVGATIITDTLALLVLAVIADSARGVALTVGFWATILFGMLALGALIWKGIPFISRWFFQRVSEKSNAQFLFVIVTVCVCAYLSHFARMEPIIGAFLAGAAFNRLIPENSPLMTRVTFAGNTLFIPFFLISVGMLVDPRALLTGSRGWLVGATMVVMVVLTKYAAAQLTRRAFHYSRSAGQVMFGLSVVQAAATLAAVVVGYNLKIFDEAVLNGAIAMILVTCPLGSWMVDRYGRRMAAEAPVQVASSSAEQRLLVPVANPDSATRLLDLAFLLRNTTLPGGIYPLAIARDHGNTDVDVAQGEKLLGHCLAHAASADLPVNPGLRVAVNISDGIIQAAREVRSGSVILGWAGERSASVRIFGTVMHHLVENCPSRLLFCRLVSPLNTTRRLLVPLPPMASHRRNLSALMRDAKMLAQRAGAELRTYTVTKETGVLLPLLDSTKPSCRTTAVEALSWDKVQQVLFAEIQPDDMILLPSDRRSGLLWTPALDHLPESIAERFPQVNLLVAYPSLTALDEETGREPAEQGEEFPVLLPAELGPDHTLEQALNRMAATAFPGSPETARGALAHLLESARSYPVELTSGTVLLHARCGDLQKPLMMICRAPGGWPMPNLPVPPGIILILLGSQSRSPEQHLKTLSCVAKRMHEPGMVQALQAARSAAELCDLLRQGAVGKHAGP